MDDERHLIKAKILLLMALEWQTRKVRREDRRCEERKDMRAKRLKRTNA